MPLRTSPSRSADLAAFGQRLKSLRKKAGLTQSEVAQRLQVSENAIVQYETGRCYPRQQRLIEISRIFAVDVVYLMSGATAEEGQTLTDLELSALRLFRLIPQDAQPDMLEAMRLYARAFKASSD